MHRQETSGEILGLLAEFDRPDRLIDSVQRARAAGFRAMDAYSPFPLDELTPLLGFEENRIPWLTLVGGILGAAVAYSLQVYTNYAYQIEIGGRPLYAWQSFMLITFELSVLFAVLFAVVGMLFLNRLPRLHHPLFDIAEFHLASSDKFFLLICSSDGRFDERRTLAFLKRLHPVRVETVRETEQPE